MTARPTMSAVDAQNVVSIAADDAPSQIYVPQMVVAPNVIADDVRRLADQHDHVRAAARRRPEAIPLVVGHDILLGEAYGSPRHSLADQPISCGSQLYLLTYNHWLAGRYENSQNPDRTITPFFHFGLPGVRDDVRIRIPSAARLAWPHELAEHQGSR